MKKEDCFSAAMEELKYFDHEGLREYAQKVLKRADEIDNKRGFKAIEQAMKEINDAKMASYFNDHEAAVNDAVKLQEASDLVRQGKADLMSVNNKMNTNLANNAEAQVAFKRNTYFQKIYGEATKEQIAYLQEKDNQLNIARAVDGQKPIDEFAGYWANRLIDYKNFRNADLVVENALALERLNDDRFLKQTHDQGKVMSGNASWIKSAINAEYRKSMKTMDAPLYWRQTIKNHIDIEKTFQYTSAADELGNIDMKAVDKMLDDIWDNISSGRSNIETISSAVTDRVALSRKGRLFFHWKTFEDQLKYNDIFGSGDLFSMLQADINSSAHKAGIAKVMGTAPTDFYNGLRKVNLEVDKEKGLRQTRLGRAGSDVWYHQADINFQTLMGKDQQIQNPTVANITDNIVAASSMARLGLVTTTAFSDLSFITAFHVRTGENPFTAMFHIVKHAFDLYEDEESKYIAKSMKSIVDTNLGFVGRWQETNNASDLIQKASQQFFKWNCLNPWDRGTKMGSMTLTAKRYYQLRSRSWGQLPKARKVFLDKFISPAEWEAIRSVEQPVRAMTYESALKVTDDNLRELKRLNPTKSFNDIRNDLSRKIFSMFSSSSENAVMNPLVFDRAIVNRANPKGTLGGVASAIIGQFKKFGVAWGYRAVKNGWADSGLAGRRVQWATTMMLMGAPPAILGTMLGHILKGQFYNVYDAWMNGNSYDKEAILVDMMASSIGMYLGIVDPKNQNSNMAIDLLASPSTRFISNALAGTTATVNYALFQNPKDLKRMKKDFMKMADYMLPLQNLPVISPLLNQIIGEKTYADKGSTQIYGK